MFQVSPQPPSGGGGGGGEVRLRSGFIRTLRIEPGSLALQVMPAEVCHGAETLVPDGVGQSLRDPYCNLLESTTHGAGLNIIFNLNYP